VGKVTTAKIEEIKTKKRKKRGYEQGSQQKTVRR
jgi:hypothetical protein